MLLLAPAAGASAHRHAVFWTRVFLFGASCVAGLLVARKRKLHRFHLHVLSTKSHDFGGFFGADIGGSLAKLVYFEPAVDAPERTGAFQATRRAEGCILQVERFLLALDSRDRQRAAHRDERLSLPGLGGTIHFISFQTSTMERVVEFVRRRFFHRHIKTIACTGGGAFKFAPLLDAKLGIHVRKVDEMDALMRGLTFTLQTAVDECYTFVDVVPSPSGRLSGTRTVVPTPPPEALYPFLLVNIGSGVSILKVTGESEFERVSGSSLGGGTFWGLLRALSRLQSFDEAMDAAAEGDSTAVDMTVGDIYGPAGYAQFQLRADTVASSFGGSARATSGAVKPRDEDVARALLFMITQNLGQVAYLNARRVGTSRIYFSGNFLRHNETACRQLSYAIDFWSKSAMQAQFFRHEGYFGALGALVATRDRALQATAVSK